MDTDYSDSAESIKHLRAQLKASETLIAELRSEKDVMEADFEYKRSKIKDLYFAKENAIRDLNSKLLEAGHRVSELEDTVKTLTEEIENVKMIAAVSENTKEEAVEEINKRHQEEIKSLQQAFQATMDEQQKDLIVQFKQERSHWEQEKSKLESSLNDINAAFNRLKDGVKNMEENAIKDSQLGLTMEAAQSEAEALKSVVVPLECEIAELKKKLAACEEKLSLEKLKNPESIFAEPDGFFIQSFVDNDSNIEKQETRLYCPISTNSHSYDELKKHIEQLTMQKLVLQKENDTLKREMHEVCRSLEKEMTDHVALNDTWKAANEQFLVVQEFHLKEMDVIQQLVTEDQWHEIQQRIKSTARAHQEEMNAVVNSIENSTITDSQSSENDEFLPFQSHPSSKPLSEITTDSLSTTLTEFQDTFSVTSVSSLPGSTAMPCPSSDTIKTVFSAPHLSLLANENNGSEEKTHHEVVQAWDEVAHRQTSSVKENKSSKKHSFSENVVLELRQTLLEQQQVNENEIEARLVMEAEIGKTAVKVQKQISELAMKLSSLEKKLEEDKQWRKTKETEDLRRLTLLQKDREQIYSEYQKLKKDHNSLKGSYEKHRIELSQEPIFPATVEGLRIQVHKYREALLGAQVEKKHIESQLQSQLSFAQDCFSAEQNAKDQLEKTFNADLDFVRAKLSSLQELNSRLERDIATKKEFEVLYEKEQLKSEAIRTKSKDIITDLKAKLKNETKLKEEFETKLSAAKNQVRSLQDSLETSEHNQQDFVKLSQSLQMQLEEIRVRDELIKASESAASSNNSSPPTKHDPAGMSLHGKEAKKNII